MERRISNVILENPKLLSHFLEHSYWIKQLNRNSNTLKDFQKQMKIIYKERPSDKVNSAIDGIEMISSVFETAL